MYSCCQSCLYLHMQPRFIYWKEVAVFVWVLSNTCLFWICIHFTFSFTIFFKNMHLQNFMPFFECSFWVMSQLDLAILTSALRFFSYNTQLSSPTTKFFCFLDALCLTAQAQYPYGSHLSVYIQCFFSKIFLCHFWYKHLMIQPALWASSALRPYILRSSPMKIICHI